MGVTWPSSWILFALFYHLPNPYSHGWWVLLPLGDHWHGWLLKPVIYSGSVCVSGKPSHSPGRVQPILTDHTNDDECLPLCHLITRYSSFIMASQGRSGHLTRPRGPFPLIWNQLEQSQLRNSLISPPSTPLITNSAESWIIPNKRQIYLPQDINKIIGNKYSEALRAPWENINSLTPAFVKS
jgi:hypothetical protein